MKFIADVMLGRLTKYIRMAGYDVAYMNNIKDDLIIEIAKKEDRIILTRDRLMLERKDIKNQIIKSVFIKYDHLPMQLKQVKYETGINLEPLFKRCIKCNAELEEIKKENAQSKVPPYVYSTQNYFLLCKSCGKIYWRGTHYKNIYEFFNKLKDPGS
ncbi:MAG: hypothetical protein FJW68_04390 [Actinobacteria bacterium]|nr:hypothetical protein [Actinomycetota bacterium]